MTSSPLRRPRLFALLALLTLPVLPAAAQPIQGLYFGGSAGLNLRPGKVLPPAPERAAPLAAGTAEHAAVGYGFAGSGLPLRLELEGVHLGNRVN